MPGADSRSAGKIALHVSRRPAHALLLIRLLRVGLTVLPVLPLLLRRGIGVAEKRIQYLLQVGAHPLTEPNGVMWNITSNQEVDCCNSLANPNYTHVRKLLQGMTLNR